jgi:hypothetical protein
MLRCAAGTEYRSEHPCGCQCQAASFETLRKNGRTNASFRWSWESQRGKPAGFIGRFSTTGLGLALPGVGTWQQSSQVKPSEISSDEVELDLDLDLDLNVSTEH